VRLTTDRLRPYSRFERVDVIVERGGGKDPKGDQLPGTTHTVPGCLVTTQRTTEEPASRSDLPETTAWLFASPGADFQPQDVVTVPDDGRRIRPTGRFVVNGDPDFGQLGCRVPLRRV